MKKIAFFIQHMICGGVEKALLSLLGSVDASDYDITVYTAEKTGDYLKKIPTSVKVCEIDIPYKQRCFFALGGVKYSVRKKIKEKKFFQAFVVLCKNIFNKKDFAELNIDFEKIKPIDVEFDVAINYHIHSPFLVKYLSEKVRAKKKISWIHNDFTTTGYDVVKLKEELSCNDSFFCVSKRLLEEFVERLPEYKDKTFLGYNVVLKDEILKRSQEYYPSEFAKNDGMPKLLTVGRLEEQKGYDIAIDTAVLLRENDVDFKWFFVGNGTLKNKIEKRIRHYHLQDKVFVLGYRDNPYPYFKWCDIYVQTSRHEGYATVLTEAKLFYKPIVSTAVAGADEQIKDGITGCITKIEAKDVFNKLIILLKNKNRCESFSNALKNEDAVYGYQYLKDIFR